MEAMVGVPQPPDWAIAWLSPGRLAPYVAAAGPDALALYRWNCQASGALFELVGWFEVAWRNTVDAAVTVQRPGRAHWLTDPTFTALRPGTRAKITEAIQRVRRRSVPTPTPGQIVAELPLGFWRFTTVGYTNSMWAPYLSAAFPHAPGRPQRHTVDQCLEHIIRLRNRLAHHEPVFAWPDQLRQRLTEIYQLGTWINPEAADWWRRHSTVEAVLDDHPLTKPT